MNDEPEDLALDVWAGVVPMTTDFGSPEPDTGVTAPTPPYLEGYTRPPRDAHHSYHPWYE